MPSRSKITYVGRPVASVYSVRVAIFALTPFPLYHRFYVFYHSTHLHFGVEVASCVGPGTPRNRLSIIRTSSDLLVLSGESSRNTFATIMSTAISFLCTPVFWLHLVALTIDFRWDGIFRRQVLYSLRDSQDRQLQAVVIQHPSQPGCGVTVSHGLIHRLNPLGVPCC